MSLTSQPDTNTKANLPNLRRLFIEARSDHEERNVSRKAVGACYGSRIMALRIMARWLVAG
jgi:hypothetical protein